MAANTDRVVEYILQNTKDLSAAKIKSLAEVVRALGGEVEKEDNNLPIQNDPALFEDAPLDLSQVTGIEVDGVPQKVKIYNN